MFRAESLGSPESATGFVLWRLTARYQREMDRVLLGLDLTHLQFVTLALVAWFEREGEPVSQANLARFAGIHPMQLSLMLKALEGKALILRERSSTDTRAKNVLLTQAGFQALRRALPLAIATQDHLFGPSARPGSRLHDVLVRLDVSSAAQMEEDGNSREF